MISPLSGCGSGGVSEEDCENDGNCNYVLNAAQTRGPIPQDPRDPFWTGEKAPESMTIELGPQLITNPQWPNPSIKSVLLAAARNSNEIAFRLEWDDPTRNDEFDTGVEYTDQIALMFPLKPKSDFPPIFMGDEDHVVNIWQWKAAWERDMRQKKSPQPEMNSPQGSFPFRGGRISSVQDLNAEGFSTLTNQDEQNVTGHGERTKNGWQVVFKRPLINEDENDIQFRSSLPMAVAVWNGGNRETNGQKGISSWILLQLK